jgi:hypothetical protein
MWNKYFKQFYGIHFIPFFIVPLFFGVVNRFDKINALKSAEKTKYYGKSNKKSVWRHPNGFFGEKLIK